MTASPVSMAAKSYVDAVRETVAGPNIQALRVRSVPAAVFV